MLSKASLILSNRAVRMLRLSNVSAMFLNGHMLLPYPQGIYGHCMDSVNIIIHHICLTKFNFSYGSFEYLTIKYSCYAVILCLF